MPAFLFFVVVFFRARFPLQTRYGAGTVFTPDLSLLSLYHGGRQRPIGNPPTVFCFFVGPEGGHISAFFFAREQPGLHGAVEMFLGT